MKPTPESVPQLDVSASISILGKVVLAVPACLLVSVLFFGEVRDRP